MFAQVQHHFQDFPYWKMFVMMKTTIFSTFLCGSILEYCFDKLETKRFVSQNHGVAKKHGIYHGFGTSEDCTDAVSQPFFLFMLCRCGILIFPQRFLETFACIQHVCKRKECYHPPPTHPISCVASNMCASARNVIIPPTPR